VDCIVRHLAGSDQILRIYDRLGTVDKILHSKRIHVMNQQSSMNLVTFDAQIATHVTKDHFLARTTPCARLVKLLIQISVETERLLSDVAR
jgi:hypothetical protein